MGEAVGDGRVSECCEQRYKDGPEAPGGQHRDEQFRTFRQQGGDPISFRNSETAEERREPPRVFEKLRICETGRVSCGALMYERHRRALLRTLVPIAQQGCKGDCVADIFGVRES